VSCRAITVAREFGSGGAEIARLIAESLSWTLIDACLIEDIAREARVAPRIAAECDERVDSWVHRFSKNTILAAVLAAGATTEGAQPFDSESMARFSAELIRKAYSTGNCVVVGRGGQCVLRGCADVLHIFVYGSVQRRTARLQARYPGRNGIREWMHARDAERQQYIREYFHQTWDDRGLYDLMLCSDFGEEASARIVVDVLRKACA
jgi:cytidylate kinase